MKNMKKEQERTLFLEKNGIYVLRFQNEEILQNFRDTCETIDFEIQKRLF